MAPHSHHFSRHHPKQKLSPLQTGRLRKLVGGLIVVALLWLLFAPGTGMLALLRQRSELQALQTKTQQLTEENVRMQKEINQLQTDKRYLEEVARKEFGLLKKDERIFDFNKPEPKPKAK